MLTYLGKLQKRMTDAGFPLNDPFYQTVYNAWDDVYALMVELHYLSYRGGVGTPSDSGGPSGFSYSSVGSTASGCVGR